MHFLPPPAATDHAFASGGLSRVVNFQLLFKPTGFSRWSFSSEISRIDSANLLVSRASLTFPPVWAASGGVAADIDLVAVIEAAAVQAVGADRVQLADRPPTREVGGAGGDADADRPLRRRRLHLGDQRPGAGVASSEAEKPLPRPGRRRPPPGRATQAAAASRGFASAGGRGFG